MIRLIKLLRTILVVAITAGSVSLTQAAVIDLSELTIDEIHLAYKKGTFNSEQLVRAYLNRIEVMDEQVNAITKINPQALSIAIRLDKEYNYTGILRPLHGIPLIVKDNINTKGMPTTAGAQALKDFIPETDAFIINKLVKAGAIIIAKSNMAEWAFSAKHTESSTAGTTINPYNKYHVPAGSSGGTAAGVAANFATIGLGTDTGNSIRGPSSHNALVGFRSTLGLVSREGIIPLLLRNDVVGPMCRTVEDATRVLEVMAGFDPADSITRYSKGKIPDSYQQFLNKDGLKGARIGVLRALSDDNPDPEVKALFEKAISDLKSLGATIIDPLVIPKFSELRQNQWCVEFKEDLAEFLATYVKDNNLRTIDDVIQMGSQSVYAEKQLLFFKDNRGRMGKPEVACSDAFTDPMRLAFRDAIENTMDRLNIHSIIYPSWNHKPAKVLGYEEGYKGDNSQIISPHTGQPAFSIPMGYTSGNLPAGLQFLGRMFDEQTLIKLVYSYEQATLHRNPPLLTEVKDKHHEI